MESKNPNDQKKEDPVQGARVLRTFEGDIQEALKKEDVSMTKIALSEQARAGKGVSLGNTDKPSFLRKKLPLLIVIVILISLGGYIIYSVGGPEEPIGGPTLVAKPTPVISVDSEREINLIGANRSSLIQALQQELSNPLAISAVRALFIKDGSVYMGTKRFFRVLETEMPAKLSLATLNEFTVGIHAFDGNHLFIILKTDSPQNAIVGMLDWERKGLAEKIAPILNGQPLPAEDKRPFEDGLIKNKDVRLLKTLDNKLILVYAFLDRDTILITNSEYTVEETLKRLNVFKTKR